MQIQKTNNQMSFGLRDIIIKDLSRFGEETIGAIEKAQPDAFKMGNDNMYVVISDLRKKAKGPVRYSGMLVEAKALDSSVIKTIINAFTDKIPTGIATDAPPVSKNGVLTLIEKAIYNLNIELSKRKTM